VVVASVALVVTSPVLLIGAVVVGLTMGRPVIFVQERAGRDGVPFRLCKLRTMRDARDSSGALLADGDRLTRVGSFLRRWSLDELPELVNVLRGEMSLVGPRPLPLAYLPRYRDDERRRLDVLPGLTGWAQVNGRNATAWDERLALDVWYVDHRSLALDLRILVRTVGVALRHQGISAEGHVTMPELRPDGPGGEGSGARS